MKTNKHLSRVFYVFTFVGVILLIVTFFLVKSSLDFKDNSTKAKGRVISYHKKTDSDDGTLYTPIIEFSIDSSKYTFRGNTYSSFKYYKLGKEVKILYLKDNPNNVKIDSYSEFWLGATIVGGLGSVFFLIGVIFPFAFFKTRSSYKELKKTGKPILTEFQKVKLELPYSKGGRKPYSIITQWENPNDNKVYTFKSEDIWFNPKKYINNESIRVYIKESNPNKYYMDISFLPKAGN